ncbi:tetratricopeptide repeat protein [bacterium]|nr:tetratricopeptide repeat protein [bacterium]
MQFQNLICRGRIALFPPHLVVTAIVVAVVLCPRVYAEEKSKLATTGRARPASAKSATSASNSGGMPLYVPEVLDLAILRKAVSIYQREPNNQLAFFDAARYFLGVRDYIAAEKLARAALRAHPQWASPNYVLAKVVDVHFEDIQCIEYFKLAIKASPHWLDASIACADKLNTCEKSAEAVAVCTEALKYCAGLPKQAELTLYMRLLRYRKAQALFNLKDFSGAAREMEADSARETEPIRLKFLAGCYVQSKQWTKALAIASRILQQSPNDYSFRLLRAQIYAAMNQPQNAIDDLSNCLQLKKYMVSNTGLGPMDVLAEQEVRVLRASMYDKLGKKELAQKDRAAVKAANDRTYKETIFRTRP